MTDKSEQIRRIGVFLPNWIGDVCMATPAIRALSAEFRDKRGAEVVGIMRPYVARVLEGTQWLDDMWFCEKNSKTPEHSSRSLLFRMRREPLDAVVLMPNSWRVAALAWLGRAKRRIGYTRDFRKPLLTDSIPMPTTGMEKPLVFRFLRMVEPLGCDVSDTRLELATTPADECRADRVWQSLNLGGGNGVVTMNCGSANSPSRRWPLARFGELARRIAEQDGMKVLVLCGPGEQELAREVTQHANHPDVVNMANQPLDLGTAKACIRRSSLMVSTDSGPKHIAVAFDRPVVTLHGPVSPLETFNPLARAVPVSLNLSCLDCRKQICPHGHNACMRDMTVDYVYRHVLLARRQHNMAA